MEEARGVARRARVAIFAVAAMLWCVFDMCVAEYCSDRVRKRNGYHWREEEREREMETGGGQKRQSGGGQQNKGKHVNPNGVLHGPSL
jgi:hypothetical protein